MKTALIIFFLLQVIDFHLCEEDEGLDTDLTAEERLEMEAVLEEADRMEAEDRIDIPKPDTYCGDKRYKMCKKKLYKLFRYAKKEADGNVNIAFRILRDFSGKCKPCICRALFQFGPRVFGKKMTLELLMKLPCYDN